MWQLVAHLQAVPLLAFRPVHTFMVSCTLFETGVVVAPNDVLAVVSAGLSGAVDSCSVIDVAAVVGRAVVAVADATVAVALVAVWSLS